ncbi:hypothetical protein [Faecalispora anaeroviscerum]|uniref:hypothetical protein n=1 Tax=Faecalispora anaeroviscerum TaxID=2991836 RepID=UPI0024BA1C57|nr:hypothetical protein [Faecalispora anaeroviscerum]
MKRKRGRFSDCFTAKIRRVKYRFFSQNCCLRAFKMGKNFPKGAVNHKLKKTKESGSENEEESIDILF